MVSRTHQTLFLLAVASCFLFSGTVRSEFLPEAEDYDQIAMETQHHASGGGDKGVKSERHGVSHGHRELEKAKSVFDETEEFKKHRHGNHEEQGSKGFGVEGGEDSKGSFHHKEDEGRKKYHEKGERSYVKGDKGKFKKGYDDEGFHHVKDVDEFNKDKGYYKDKAFSEADKYGDSISFTFKSSKGKKHEDGIFAGDFSHAKQKHNHKSKDGKTSGHHEGHKSKHGSHKHHDLSSTHVHDSGHSDDFHSKGNKVSVKQKRHSQPSQAEHGQHSEVHFVAAPLNALPPKNLLKKISFMTPHSPVYPLQLSPQKSATRQSSQPFILPAPKHAPPHSPHLRAQSTPTSYQTISTLDNKHNPVLYIIHPNHDEVAKPKSKGTIYTTYNNPNIEKSSHIITTTDSPPLSTFHSDFVRSSDNSRGHDTSQTPNHAVNHQTGYNNANEVRQYNAGPSNNQYHDNGKPQRIHNRQSSHTNEENHEPQHPTTHHHQYHHHHPSSLPTANSNHHSRENHRPRSPSVYPGHHHNEETQHPKHGSSLPRGHYKNEQDQGNYQYSKQPQNTHVDPVKNQHGNSPSGNHHVSGSHNRHADSSSHNPHGSSRPYDDDDHHRNVPSGNRHEENPHRSHHRSNAHPSYHENNPRPNHSENSSPRSHHEDSHPSNHHRNSPHHENSPNHNHHESSPHHNRHENTPHYHSRNNPPHNPDEDSSRNHREDSASNTYHRDSLPSDQQEYSPRPHYSNEADSSRRSIEEAYHKNQIPHSHNKEQSSPDIQNKRPQQVHYDDNDRNEYPHESNNHRRPHHHAEDYIHPDSHHSQRPPHEYRGTHESHDHNVKDHHKTSDNSPTFEFENHGGHSRKFTPDDFHDTNQDGHNEDANYNKNSNFHGKSDSPKTPNYKNAEPSNYKKSEKSVEQRKPSSNENTSHYIHSGSSEPNNRHTADHQQNEENSGGNRGNVKYTPKVRPQHSSRQIRRKVNSRGRRILPRQRIRLNNPSSPQSNLNTYNSIETSINDKVFNSDGPNKPLQENKVVKTQTVPPASNNFLQHNPQLYLISGIIGSNVPPQPRSYIYYPQNPALQTPQPTIQITYGNQNPSNHHSQKPQLAQSINPISTHLHLPAFENKPAPAKSQNSKPPLVKSYSSKAPQNILTVTPKYETQTDKQRNQVIQSHHPHANQIHHEKAKGRNEHYSEQYSTDSPINYHQNHFVPSEQYPPPNFKRNSYVQNQNNRDSYTAAPNRNDFSESLSHPNYEERTEDPSNSTPFEEDENVGSKSSHSFISSAIVPPNDVDEMSKVNIPKFEAFGTFFQIEEESSK